MTDRTATPRQNRTADLVVERFRCETEDGNRSLVFEQSHDLTLAVQAIDDGGGMPDFTESQILIRHDVDGDPLTIVYVDGPHGKSDDASVLASVIPALQRMQEALAGLEGGAR